MSVVGAGELLQHRSEWKAKPRCRLVLPGAERGRRADQRLRRVLEGREGGEVVRNSPKKKSGQPGAPEAVPMKTLPVRRATTGLRLRP